jgi:type VI secretion system secreted protein Hcp
MTFQGDGCPPVEPPRRGWARRKMLTIALPTGVALGAGAVIASGAIPAADGTIGTCYVPGSTVRFVDSAADCREGESFLRFNQVGPQGPQGATGATGAAGAAGAPGAPGASGPGALGIPVHPIPASDYLLEIDGIKGESSDAKHKDTITIESFSWGATQGATRSSGGGGGAGAGKVVFQDLHVVKATDKSSPALFQAVATGRHLKKATLFVRKAGGEQQEYLKITLTDLVVSSYKTGPQAPGVGQTEDVAFEFGKIELDYRPQLPDGSLGGAQHGGWDVKANKKL